MIQFAMREDQVIETLLDLHDQIIDQGDGYWVKIEAGSLLFRRTFLTGFVIR